MERIFFSKKLINWYQTNKRELPWRDTQSAYHIWLSEIILQQTRVAQGLPYFEKFAQAFPTIHDLAAADEREVLRLWQGLGYYSRARNLHACAKMVVEEYGGKFPQEYSELLKLKGVGKYTAAAIASFAFKKAVPAIDGNAFRFFARYFGLDHDIAQAKSFNVFFELGSQLIPDDQPDDFNQAVMEFGATHCTPKNPSCGDCVFAATCFANMNSKQAELPVKKKKIKIKKRHFHYFIFKHEDQILMKERLEKDIWQGLYDFYLLEEEDFKSIDQLADHDTIGPVLRQNSVIEHVSDPFKHILSHQHIFARFFEIKITNKKLFNQLISNQSAQAFELKQVHELPKPILVDNYLQANIF